MDTIQFGLTFQVLLLAHLLGDFPLQPYRLVLAKQRGWPGLLTHAGIHSVVILMLAGRSAPGWLLPAVVLWLWHALVDWTKVQLTDRWPRWEWQLFYLDQAVHLITALATALWAVRAGWPQPAPLLPLVAVRNLPAVNALVALFFAGPVVIWVTARALGHTLGGITLGDRLLGGWERTAWLTTCYLAAGGHWGGALFAAAGSLLPRAALGRERWTPPEQAQLLLSLVMTVAVAALWLGPRLVGP